MASSLPQLALKAFLCRQVRRPWGALQYGHVAISKAVSMKLRTDAAATRISDGIFRSLWSHSYKSGLAPSGNDELEDMIFYYDWSSKFDRHKVPVGCLWLPIL